MLPRDGLIRVVPLVSPLAAGTRKDYLDTAMSSTGGRTGWMLWSLGMTGAVAAGLQVLPTLLADRELPLPRWAMGAISLVQSGVYLLIAVLIGCKLGPQVGLGAPILAGTQSLTSGATWRSLAGAFGVGAGCGVLLHALGTVAPEGIRTLGETLRVPLLTKVLYGGITEEVLIRWGLMTFILWLLVRLSGHRASGHGLRVGAAITVSALLFGLGHLPVVAAMAEALTASVVVYVLAGNFGFGVVFGYLYFRRGIESAMVAHATAHVVAVMLSGM